MPAPELLNYGRIHGASNVTKGSTHENITIINQSAISFTGTSSGGYLTSLTFTSGVFTRSNNEAITLKCLSGTPLTFAVNNVPITSGRVPSTILTVASGSLTQIYSGLTDLTTLGSVSRISGGTLYITSYNDSSVTGTINYMSLIVTGASLSNSTSSFCGTTYTETLNATTLSIPSFNNNSITMGGFNIVTCIQSSTDLPLFYNNQSVIIVVKNINITTAINVTIYTNSSEGSDDIYYFGNALDSVPANKSSVYLQLATGIFTKLFGG